SNRCIAHSTSPLSPIAHPHHTTKRAAAESFRGRYAPAEPSASAVHRLLCHLHGKSNAVRPARRDLQRRVAVAARQHAGTLLRLQLHRITVTADGTAIGPIHLSTLNGHHCTSSAGVHAPGPDRARCMPEGSTAVVGRTPACSMVYGAGRRVNGEMRDSARCAAPQIITVSPLAPLHLKWLLAGRGTVAHRLYSDFAMCFARSTHRTE